MSYRIAWRSRITGHQGHGKCVFSGKEECQEHCNKADIDWPEISHWPEECA